MTRRTLYSNPSWMVEFSSEEDCIVVTTSDYHAGPLKISAEQWQAFGRQYVSGSPEYGALNVRTDKVQGKGQETQRAASIEASEHFAMDGPVRSGDLNLVAGNESLTLSISRRERRVIIQCVGSESKPLAISRRELYRIGKSMGKRGSKGRFPSAR